MRNLTKVLAMVLALTMMVSVVGFAASYTDVEKGANYEEAVNVLSGLGLVQGMGDGTFGAELNLTRAQGAAFVIRLMGLEETAVSATGLDTGFADVAADHWATGYIYTGVQKGIINGMGDGTFAPDAELTYAQLITMVVKALGYEPLAAELGEWPGNYISAASQIKLTKGIAGVADATITRATTARVLYAALTIPKMEKDGVGVNATWKPAETLILDDLGFYKMIGEVKSVELADGKFHATLTAQGKAIDGKYKETTNVNYLDMDLTAAGNVATGDEFALGAFGAELKNYIGLEDSALYFTYANREYTLVAIVEDNKDIDTVTLTTADFKELVSNELTYYTNAEQTKEDEIELASAITVYLNGTQLSSTKTPAQFETAYFGDVTNVAVEVFEIELKDTNGNGDFDYAIVTDYDYLIVDEIDVDRDGEYTITGLNTVFGGTDEIIIDTEDEADEYVKIVKDGKEISVADIEVGDILNIIAPANNDGTANDYSAALTEATIYVTNDTVEGMVKHVIDGVATIGDEEYVDRAGLSRGNEGTFYLNILGQIIDVDNEVVINAYDYGFATSIEFDVDDTTIEAGTITILTTEGKWVTYDLASKVTVNGTVTTMGKTQISASTLDRNAVNTDGDRFYYEEIVAYKLNAEGAVKEVVTSDYMTTAGITYEESMSATEYKEYDDDDSEFGAYIITEATVVYSIAPDATNGVDDLRISTSEVTVTDLSVLVDEKTYTGVSVYNVNAKTDVPAVMIGNDFVADIDFEDAWFVVSSDAVDTYYGDNDNAYAIKGIVNGEVTTYYYIPGESEVGLAGDTATTDGFVDNNTSATVSDETFFTKGMVMIVKANANNEIIDASVIGDVTDYVTTGSVVANTLVANVFDPAKIQGADKDSYVRAGLVAKVNGTKVDVVYGVSDVTSVLKGTGEGERYVNKNATIPGSAERYTITSNTKVTVYDYTVSAKNTVSAGSTKDIKAGTAVFTRVDENGKLVEVVVIVTENDIDITPAV